MFLILVHCSCLINYGLCDGYSGIIDQLFIYPSLYRGLYPPKVSSQEAMGQDTGIQTERTDEYIMYVPLKT